MISLGDTMAYGYISCDHRANQHKSNLSNHAQPCRRQKAYYFVVSLAVAGKDGNKSNV